MVSPRRIAAPLDRSAVGSRVEVEQCGADPVGVWMAEFVERDEGVPVLVAGGIGPAGGVVGFGEVDPGHGLVVDVVEVVVQVDRPLVAGDRRVVFAEVVVGISEGVPGVGLPGPVAENPGDLDRLPAVGQRVVVPAQPDVMPADRVQRMA